MENNLVKHSIHFGVIAKKTTQQRNKILLFCSLGNCAHALLLHEFPELEKLYIFSKNKYAELKQRNAKLCGIMRKMRLGEMTWENGNRIIHNPEKYALDFAKNRGEHMRQ